jgi:CRP/FNR family cyclic AMP-dependent transcriptional regulator
MGMCILSGLARRWRFFYGSRRDRLPLAVSDTISPRPLVRPEQLADIGLFGGLSEEVLRELAATLDASLFDPGAVVMREGEQAREMFVVLSGELEVLRRSKGGTEGRVALLGPGSWVGEMSILDVQPRSATVRTLAPAILLCIKGEDLDRLYRRDMRAYLLVVLNIARELSRRLRVADGMIAGFLSAILDDNMGFHQGSKPTPPSQG